MIDERRFTLQIDSSGISDNSKMAQTKHGLKMASNDFQTIIDNLRITIFGKKEKQIFTPQKKYKMVIENNMVEDQIAKIEYNFYKIIKDLYWSKYELLFPKNFKKSGDKHGLNRSTTIDSEDLNYCRDDYLK